jgi:hypothetical protein
MSYSLCVKCSCATTVAQEHLMSVQPQCTVSNTKFHSKWSNAGQDEKCLSDVILVQCNDKLGSFILLILCIDK